MSLLFAIETTLLRTGAVDILIGLVVLPQPADDLVAGMEGGLLAFDACLFGGYLFEEEVVE